MAKIIITKRFGKRSNIIVSVVPIEELLLPNFF